jgi:hypothetical protein
MHSLNLIIPRPDEDKIKFLATEPPTQPAPDEDNGSTRLQFLKSLFQKEISMIQEIPDPILSASVREKNLTYPSLLIKEYGSPLYSHLSRGSWELLLLSRCYLEEIVKLLGLEVGIVSNLTPLHLDDEDDIETVPKQQPSWKLDSSIPISNSKTIPRTPIKRGDQINRYNELYEDVPTLHLPPNSKTKEQNSEPKAPQRELPTTTIQQRIDNPTSLPYRTNNENRLRRKVK